MPLNLVEQLTLWGYGVVTRLARPLLRQKLRKRAQAEPGYAHDIEARFGHYRKLPQKPVTQQGEGGEAGPLIWVHAVSLGEARAAAILVDSLRRLMPEMRLLLTHSTATGWSEGAGMLRPNDAQTWLPWDDAGSVNRFLRHFRPAVGVLMETEVWPLLIQACRRQGVPLALANARLNERSFNQSLRLSWLSRPAYAGLAAVWAQTDDDARRLTLAGAQVAAVTGNLKFDARPDPAERKLAAHMAQCAEQASDAAGQFS
jgi:3-deoxy-D-manno-octulosonic-acid transferase